jgi:Uma2 family endonuclease
MLYSLQFTSWNYYEGWSALSGDRFISSPKQRAITIYQLENGEYLAGKVFRGDDPCGICEAARIESILFPTLDLTAAQIFAMSL